MGMGSVGPSQMEGPNQSGVSSNVTRLEGLVSSLANENNVLRSLLAKGNGDCPYCGLPAAEISRCASGFPGCARMDDIMAASISAVEQALEAKVDAMYVENRDLKGRISRLMKLINEGK